MTVLVTGAAGKTGLAILRALRRKEISCRAFVRQEQQIETVIAAGADEALVGDFRDRAALRRAVDGAQRIYHICPNFCVDEVEIGRDLIELAVECQVEHFVYHSVLHPQVEAMPHHWRKLRVEQQLFASGLSFTILQPSAYLQNLTPYWQAVLGGGELKLPFSTESLISMVDLGEVAEIAAVMLADLSHGYGTYELCGPPISHRDVAEAFSKSMGRPVASRRVPIETWRRDALASGMSEAQCAEPIAMFQYYDELGFVGNANILSWLLGRSPATLQSFVKRLSSARE